MMPTATNPGVMTTAPTDEELVLLTRADGAQAAALQALYDRHGGAMRRYAAWWVRVHARDLPGAEPEDAAQEGALAFVLAVAAYRVAPPGRPDPGRFRAFLWRVTRGRLRDWARGLLRAERRLDRARDAAWELDDRAAGGTGGPSARRPGDPAALAEWAEAQGRLEEVLGRLGDEARRLWDGRCEGRRPCALADEAGLSRRRAGRVWRRLRAALRQALSADGLSRRSRRRTRGGLP